MVYATIVLPLQPKCGASVVSREGYQTVIKKKAGIYRLKEANIQSGVAVAIERCR